MLRENGERVVGAGPLIGSSDHALVGTSWERQAESFDKFRKPSNDCGLRDQVDMQWSRVLRRDAPLRPFQVRAKELGSVDAPCTRDELPLLRIRLTAKDPREMIFVFRGPSALVVDVECALELLDRGDVFRDEGHWFLFRFDSCWHAANMRPPCPVWGAGRSDDRVSGADAGKQ